MAFPSQILSRGLAALRRRALGTIVNVATRLPIAALTFDDGPNREYTPRLLEILERHEAQATFFMVGEAASKHPDIVEEVARQGHAIGNHTWDHPSLPLLTPSERRWQFRACEQAIAPYSQGLLRPPYGHQTARTRFDAVCSGLQVITWDVAAEDWLSHDSEWIAERVMSRIKPGSIILFHDSLCTVVEQGLLTREPTLAAVSIILKRLSGCFRFVTVPELLCSGIPRLQSWSLVGDPHEMSLLREPDGSLWRYASRVESQPVRERQS